MQTSWLKDLVSLVDPTDKLTFSQLLVTTGVTASAMNNDALRRAQEAIAAIRIRVTAPAALPMEIAVA